VDAEGNRDDRVVLRADDHGADDEDLRVRQDADGADQPGDGEQDVEARGVGRAGADDGFHDFPHRCLLPPQRTVLGRAALVVGDRGVHLLHPDHAHPIEARVAQGGQHRIRGVLAHVEMDGVTVRPASGPGVHHDVVHAGSGDQAVGQLLGEVLRAHHADVQHPPHRRLSKMIVPAGRRGTNVSNRPGANS
jgi:hypothetical protein